VPGSLCRSRGVQLEVIARAGCRGSIFSNYNSKNKAQQTSYNLNTINLLRMSTYNGKALATKMNYAEYFNKGTRPPPCTPASAPSRRKKIAFSIISRGIDR
jgi:hypothetical protein